MRVRVDHHDGPTICTPEDVPELVRRYGTVTVRPIGHTGQPAGDPWEPYYEGRSR